MIRIIDKFFFLVNMIKSFTKNKTFMYIFNTIVQCVNHIFRM